MTSSYVVLPSILGESTLGASKACFSPIPGESRLSKYLFNVMICPTSRITSYNVCYTKLLRSGAFNIAQDEKTSIVYGMPKVALDMGGVDEVLPIDEIAGRVISCLQGKK